MAFDKHGQTGANIFIAILILVSVMPLIRIFNNMGLIYTAVITGLLVMGAWINAKTIIRYGSSSAGEAFGIISGLLVWLTSWGTGKIGRLAAGEDILVDVARMVAVALVSCMGLIVWRWFGRNFNSPVKNAED